MELHYPGYEFLGPGTNLDKTKDPINELDAAAQKHDSHYKRYSRGRSDYYYRYGKADEQFLQDIKNIHTLPAHIAKLLFKSKKFLTKAVGMADMESLQRGAPMSVADLFRAVKKPRRTRTNYKGQRRLTLPYVPRHLGNYRKSFMLKSMKRRGSRKRSFKRRPMNGRRHSRRFKRSKGRRSSSRRTTTSILNKINPTRLYSIRTVNRAKGTINKADHIQLTIGRHVAAATPFVWSQQQYTPGASNHILTALLKVGFLAGTTATDFESGMEFYYKELHKFLLSNNSNVTMKVQFYYVKSMVDHVTNFGNYIFDTDVINNASFFAAGGQPDMTQSVTQTPITCDFTSRISFNLFQSRDVQKFIQKDYRIIKGKRMILNPGQTKALLYKQNKFRYLTKMKFFDRDNNQIYYPKGTIEIYMRFVGDILKAEEKTSTTPPAPNYEYLNVGVNAGDFGWEHNIYVKALRKLTYTGTRYFDEDTFNQGTTAGNIKVFGFDNNDATTAI